MQNDDSKLSMWVVLAAVVCCGLPLLLLISGGSILALIGGYLTGSNLLLALALILVLVFVWLILRRSKL